MTHPAAHDPSGHDADTTAAAHDVHGATDDHGDALGHDAAHGEESLGPIDLAAWGAGALGVVIGIAIAACFVLSTGSV